MKLQAAKHLATSTKTHREFCGARLSSLRNERYTSLLNSCEETMKANDHYPVAVAVQHTNCWGALLCCSRTMTEGITSWKYTNWAQYHTWDATL